MNDYPQLWVILVEDKGKWKEWNTYRTQKAAIKSMNWYRSLFPAAFGEEPPPTKVVLYHPQPDKEINP